MVRLSLTNLSSRILFSLASEGIQEILICGHSRRTGLDPTAKRVEWPLGHKGSLLLSTFFYLIYPSTID